MPPLCRARAALACRHLFRLSAGRHRGAFTARGGDARHACVWRNALKLARGTPNFLHTLTPLLPFILHVAADKCLPDCRVSRWILHVMALCWPACGDSRRVRTAPGRRANIAPRGAAAYLHALIALRAAPLYLIVACASTLCARAHGAPAACAHLRRVAFGARGARGVCMSRRYNLSTSSPLRISCRKTTSSYA